MAVGWVIGWSSMAVHSFRPDRQFGQRILQSDGRIQDNGTEVVLDDVIVDRQETGFSIADQHRPSRYSGSWSTYLPISTQASRPTAAGPPSMTTGGMSA
jgi:hypothetical protein